jgi:CBS domain containing-hemolysin-like protein
MSLLGRVPERGDVVEILLPDRSDPDLPPRLARLTVEHMDGLRVDRIALRVSGRGQEGTS